MSLSWWDYHLARTLSSESVPKHVVLLGDGSRSWARTRNMDVWKGQEEGGRNCVKMAKFFCAIKCPELTYFIFAIANFQRDHEEVSILMDVIDLLIAELTALSGELQMKIRVLGETSLLVDKVQKRIAEAEQITAHQTAFTLNLIMPYSSRSDITNAIKRVVVEEGGGGDGAEELIDEYLCTAQCQPVDLLIRTSESRLSDFFLWEVSRTSMYFVDRLWPSTSCWDLAKCVLEYQERARKQAIL